jgi:putative thioredoxin
MLARTFQITSIPTVLALRGGEIVSEFVGAQPEAFIRQFVKDLLPSEAELLALDGEKKRKAGRFDEAEKVFEEALQKDRDSSPALLGLARLRADQGRTADALSLLDQVPPGTAERAEAERLAARLRVQATAPVNTADLAERVKENPGDLESRSALGLALAAGGRYAEALEQFLEIVARDKGAGGENARKAVLDIFQILGPEHPVTVQYRSRLANLLFA